MAQSQALFIAGDANATVQGLVRLTSDFGGTATAPLVKALNGVALPAGTPTSGQTLVATGPSTFTYATPSAASSKRVVAGTYGASYAPNANTTDILRITATGAINFTAPSGSPVDGQTLQIEVTQDGTGSRAVSFSSAYTFSTTNPVPTATTTANATDLFVFQYNANISKWRLVGVDLGY